MLCSIANCTIVRGSGTPRVPLQAACGCLAPRRDGGVVGTSYVTPNIIKSRQTYEATVRRCFGGADPSAPGANTTCTTANSAPVCAAINARTMYGGAWPLFSTFAVFTDQGTQVCAVRGSNLPCMHGQSQRLPLVCRAHAHAAALACTGLQRDRHAVVPGGRLHDSGLLS